MQYPCPFSRYMYGFLSNDKIVRQKVAQHPFSSSFNILYHMFNTLRPRQNGRHFADDIFKCIFLNEYVWIPNKISLKFVPKGPINNIPTLVQIMAWRRSGDKPLSEPMMVSLTTHICVTRPQWVNMSTKADCTAGYHYINRFEKRDKLVYRLTHWGWDKMDAIWYGHLKWTF